MITRIKQAKLPQDIILCTTNLPEDRVFDVVVARCQIKVINGHPTDILQRWLDAADKLGVDYFISAEADDVFCDPGYIDKLIPILQSDQYDYINFEGLPFGVTPTGINVEALRKICSLKKDVDTEGQERFFTKTGLFRVRHFQVKKTGIMNQNLRMTLDYREDYDFFKEVFAHLYQPGKHFTLNEILQLLKDYPEIAKINWKMQDAYTQRYNEKYNPKDLLRV